jgi:ubiquinone biosynthesis protein COQ9
MDDNVLREKVALAMLAEAPFDGWSCRALVRAANRFDITEAELGSLFPHGVRDAARIFSAWADRETEKKLARKKLSLLKMREKIALGVMERLDTLEAHREGLRRLLAFLALPLNLPLGIDLLYRTVDTLWHAAGDRATDFSFYTKRGLLAGIYVATTFYWLDDKSPDHAKTRAFLDRRITEVMQIPKLRARAAETLDSFVPPRFRRAS